MCRKRNRERAFGNMTSLPDVGGGGPNDSWFVFINKGDPVWTVKVRTATTYHGVVVCAQLRLLSPLWRTLTPHFHGFHLLSVSGSIEPLLLLLGVRLVIFREDRTLTVRYKQDVKLCNLSIVVIPLFMFSL